MIRVNTEGPPDEGEERGRDERADSGRPQVHLRRWNEPEEHRERDEQDEDRRDGEDEVLLEQHPKVAVALEHRRGRERQAHQQRPPEEEHRERDDLLAVGTGAPHLPDLIHGGLDGEEESERDDHERDRAEGRGGLRVLGEAGEVIREGGGLIRDDDVEDAVDLRLEVGEERAEVAAEDLRERDEERDQREERRVRERRGARRPLDLVELASHLADEEEELDGENARFVAPGRLAPVDEHGRIGQPSPDDQPRRLEPVEPALPLAWCLGLRGVAHRGKCRRKTGDSRQLR